jgi:hypothetical protein
MFLSISSDQHHKKVLSKGNSLEAVVGRLAKDWPAGGCAMMMLQSINHADSQSSTVTAADSLHFMAAHSSSSLLTSIMTGEICHALPVDSHRQFKFKQHHEGD